MSSAEALVELLLAIAVLAGFAQLIDVPYPVVLVIGGAALGFVPGAPHVRLDPELVFFIFLLKARRSARNNLNSNDWGRGAGVIIGSLLDQAARSASHSRAGGFSSGGGSFSGGGGTFDGGGASGDW